MPKIFPRRRTQLAQSQALQTLAPHHRAMARLAAMGMRQGDLAQRFTLSGAQVSKILASPLFQSEMLRISEGMEMEAGEAERELTGLVPRAIEIVSADLFASTEGPDPQITKREQRRLAFEVLDRTGHGKKSDMHIGDKVVNITYAVPEPGTDPEEAMVRVQEIKRIAEQACLPSGTATEDEGDEF